MLIKISPDINFNDTSKNYSLAIENLAAAARSGDHAVVAELGTLTFLSEWTDLGLPSRNLYKTLIRKWPQFPSLESIVSKKIVTGDFDEVKKITTENGEEIQIPISMFDSRELSQKTKLILEDVGDEPIYQMITEWFLEKKKGVTNSRPYVCNAIHGGGQRTAFVYKNIERREKSLILCIVDTDKKYPDCTYGDTATRVRSAHDVENHLNHALYLETQELENLIPLSLYAITLNKSPENAALVNAYDCLKIIESRNATRFFDFKKGIKCLHLNVTAENEALKEFWTPIVDAIPFDKDCNYQACDGDSCKKLLIKNWPNIKDTRDETERLRIAKQFDFDITPWLATEWERIGQKILDWCLRYEPINT